MNKLTPEQVPGHAFLNREGQQKGSYTIDQINELLLAGQAQWSDWVWAEGWPVWKQLSSLELTTPPPPPTTMSEPAAQLNGASDPLFFSDQNESDHSDAKAVSQEKSKPTDNESADVQISLGNKYYQGDGVKQDYHQAFFCYLKAAKLGDALAQYEIGHMYDDGQGLAQDYGQAFIWYQRAADQGNAAAQWRLGCLYEDGEVVEQDYSLALLWYRKSADQGNAAAQYRLGDVYFMGRGAKEDYTQAFNWYQKAADQGDADAQYKVGFMLQYGAGVLEDRAKAKEWYKKSGAQGNAEALKALESLSSRPHKALATLGKLGNEEVDLKGGYWLNDTGAIQLYIPDKGKDSPLWLLAHFYDDIAYGDEAITTWVRANLAKYAKDPKADRMEFWRLFCMFLLTHRWHLIWKGSLYSRWDPARLAKLLQDGAPGIQDDLKWDAEACVQYKYINFVEDAGGISFAWAFFCNPMPVDPMSIENSGRDTEHHDREVENSGMEAIPDEENGYFSETP